MQTSININDGTGLEVLEGINETLETLTTNFSGETEPPTKYPGMFWFKTSSPQHLYQRNALNTFWIDLGEIVNNALQPNNVLLANDPTITKQGNIFNVADSLVMLDSQGGIPSSLLESIDLPIIPLGDIIDSPNFLTDRTHTGYVKANIGLNLSNTIIANKLKTITFDFNIQPGRSMPLPSNAKSDFGISPSFVAFPDLRLNIATLNNMVLTFPATSGQYVDFTQIPLSTLGTQNWELILNLTPTQTLLQYLTSASTNTYAPLIVITAANKFGLYLSSNTTTWNISSLVLGTYTVVQGANVYVKLEFTGTAYKLWVSADGIDWGALPDINVPSTLSVSATVLTGLFRLGQYSGGTTANLFKGTIDLTKSSFKIGSSQNLLVPPSGVFLNRLIFDTIDGGSNYKAHYERGGY